MAHNNTEINRLFFTCIIYSSEEIERLLALPVWLRCVRKLYVWSLDWLNPEIRDWLNLR